MSVGEVAVRIALAVCLSVAIFVATRRGVEREAGARRTSREHTPSYGECVSCRECHERFHELWEPSHRGLAMQPFTADFARTFLTPQTNPLVIGNCQFRAEFGADRSWVCEKGPDGLC